jgi:1-acyl-sn-glycerol-3-phosphate acyltransferase
MPDSDHLRNFKHGLIVTNHISWLDVFVLNTLVPMRFVAKSDVRHWPVLGWLCVRAQTLFIERGKARSAARINIQMTELLKGGESLAIFPEGTTTDGNQVAHFHSSLLQPAIDAGVHIYPITLRYQNVHGIHSLAPAYIADISFATSLWRILNTDELHVRLVTTAPLDTSTGDRRGLTRLAQQQISTTLQAMQDAAPHPAQPDADISRDGFDERLHFRSLYCVLLDSRVEKEHVPHHAE